MMMTVIRAAVLVALAGVLVAGCQTTVEGTATPKPSVSAGNLPIDLRVPLEFRPVVAEFPAGSTGQEPPAGTVPSKDGVSVYQLDEPFLTLARLEAIDAALSPQFGTWVINLNLTEPDAETFGEWTATHIGERLAIVADQVVLTAPEISSAIPGGNVQISGQFSEQDARNLVRDLTGR